MAWFNPATWAPVDRLQDSISGVSGPKPGQSYGNSSSNYSGLTSQAQGPSPQVLGASTTVQAGVVGNEQAPNSGVYQGDGGAAARAAAQAARDRASTVALYDDSIGRLSALLGNVGTTRNQGVARLEDQYNLDNTRLNQQQSQTLRDYALKREEDTASKGKAINTIESNARTNNQSLQRLLGLAGAGVSSAAQIIAPDAVARSASKQRGDTIDNFGRNMRKVDLAETDAKQQYADRQSDLARQKNEKRSALEQSLIEYESGINEKLAEAAGQRAQAQGGDYNAARAAAAQYNNAISANQGRLNALFDQYRNPVYNIAPVNVQVPELAQYTIDNQRIAAEQANPQADPGTLPYGQFLKKDEELIPNFL